MSEFWNLNLGWFALGTFVILSLVIIGMELICRKQKRDTYIDRGGG